MSGPQVIEVVVIDSDIDDTDESKGEPDVTVNGKILRMAQAVDGNWYGYFADRKQASIADYTSADSAGSTGEGLDFGTFCSLNTNWAGEGITFTDTVGVAFPVASSANGEQGSATGAAFDADSTCKEPASEAVAGAIVNGTAGKAMNVLRETKTLNTNTVATVGQIGLNASGNDRGQADLDSMWPFIQLYALNPTGNVVVQYNKGGGVQSTTLTFDTVDQFASAALDRAVYPQSSQVHVTITDLWLNIDPTDEDSWTFGTNSSYAASQVGATDGDDVSTNYQVFNENGAAAGAASVGGIVDISGNMTNMMIEDNGVLKLNADAQSSGTAILTLQDNDDTVLTCTSAQNAATCSATGSAVVGLGINTQPITLTEQGPNTGVFGTYDESDASVILVTDDALRGTSATIDYNEHPVTVLVGFDFGTVDIQPIDDEWSSGEEIPFILVDGDANKNSRADEDLDLFDTTVAVIPALQTGDPFTLGESGVESSNNTQVVFANFSGTDSRNANVVTTAQVKSYDASANTYNQIGDTTLLSNVFNWYNVTTNTTVEKFSERAVISNSTTFVTHNDGVGSGGDGNNNGVVNATFIDLETTIADLRSTIHNTNSTSTFNGFNFLNLDVRSVTTTGTVDVYLLNSTGEIILDGTRASGGGNLTTSVIGALLIADNVKPQSLTSLNSTNTGLFETSFTLDTNNIGLAIVYSSPVTIDATEAIVADFLSFGFINDGFEASERIANQIIRIEAEETGDNTSTFAGTLEYKMINQLNILNPDTYTGLKTIDDEVTFIVIEDLTDEDAPRVNYLDLGSDGVSTQVADQEEAPSHSGVVSFDSNNYKNADTVTITLEDLDLNVDSDLIDIYTVVSTNADQNQDSIGTGNATTGGFSITLSNGDELGRLLDITFDDVRWQTPDGSCTLTGAAATDTGLGATGFTLVESGAATGVFEGDFQIPNQWCRTDSATAETSTGLDIEVNYVDFRDASGEVIEVGDSAGVRANTGVAFQI
jgi:hypothetical protein